MRQSTPTVPFAPAQVTNGYAFPVNEVLSARLPQDVGSPISRKPRTGSRYCEMSSELELGSNRSYKIRLLGC